MSQPSVAAFFNTRKRAAPDDLKNRAKVLILDQAQRDLTASSEQIDDNPETSETSVLLTPVSEEPNLRIVYAESSSVPSENDNKTVLKANRVVRNIQFDSPKSVGLKNSKMSARPRATRSRKLSVQEGQVDIRETFLKLTGESSTAENKNVAFQKKGALSPKKKGPATPTKNPNVANEQPAAGSVTPKKSLMDTLAKQDLSLVEIKNRISRSSRLAELKASMARFKKGEAKLDELSAKNDVKKPQIRKFEKIELEVPVSPQKNLQSPRKNFLSPTKNMEILKNASPQKRLLFSPKEAVVSPVKSSPSKVPAYQRHLYLAESGSGLTLPYKYRLLAEAFRCVDTVAAMLYNRKETITLNKLKPAVQEMLRRNFNAEHLAQIKTVYPTAFNFNQEKHHNYGSASKYDKYQLVITPVVESNNGRNTPDADNVLKSASESSMSPAVLLARKRTFFNNLLDLVKDQHEKFLLALEKPLVISKEELRRWHPAFDLESCEDIKQAELPQPPNVEKPSSAKDILDRAKSLFNCNTRMEKALQRLAEAKMTTQSRTETTDAATQVADDSGVRKVEISVVDTPPATPTTQSTHLSTMWKGIPKALLEKVRAKQAAKALEAMTRTPTADKEATVYSRLPELSKILRNIFVAEKKGVLLMEFVIKKLDNSYRAKLTPNELEEHIRLLCKLLPTWISIHNVRKLDYLKLAKDVDLAKVVKRLEIMANDKVNG